MSNSPDIFDEYTRRQYLVKAPSRNPFGEDEEPAKFNDLDIFTRIRVLHQLSVWTLGNADRIRGLMPDSDHLEWRMEPLGWDKEDRAYFVLDDNRLYRRTDEPIPPPEPKPKAKAKSKPKPTKGKSRGTRASKRRRIEETSDEEVDEVKEEDAAEGAKDDEDTKMVNGVHNEKEKEEEGYGFTSKTWECIAVTLEEYNDFLATIFRTRDPNERQLRKTIEENVLPIIEERAERLRNQKLKELRDLEVQAQLATAKRSGRLAQKQEREKIEKEEREAEEKKRAELREAHAEEERLRRIEEGHESRRQTREQRLKEREMKRILHEEQLARLEEDATRASSQDPLSDPNLENGKRVSNRQNQSERERHKKELERLAEEEDTWYFDCVKCHKHGDNFDDGTHSIACEKCNVWQHSECHGIKPEQAEDEDFHFICSRCRQKEADAKKPKIAPIKLGKNPHSSSPPNKKPPSRPATSNHTNGTPKPQLPEHVVRQLDGVYVQQQYPRQSAGPFGPTAGQSYPAQYGIQQGPQYPPVANFAPRPPAQFSPPQQPWQGGAFPPPRRPSSSGYSGSPPPHVANGYGSPNQHQQQHQAMHQHAMTAAGGHHPPHDSQNLHANGYSPRGSTNIQPAPHQGPPPQQQYRYYQPTPHQYTTQGPPAQAFSQLPRPGSQGQLMNGFQSPTKAGAQPASASPPQHAGQHYQQRSPPQTQPQYQSAGGYSQQPMYQAHLAFSRSPNAQFPPQQRHTQHASSPMKSSPSPAQQPPAPQGYQPRQPLAAAIAQTPTAIQPLRAESLNGATPSHPHATPMAPTFNRASPHGTGNPSPAGTNATNVAADGMSGPWPEGTKVIPQKHDLAPAQAPAVMDGASPSNSQPFPATPAGQSEAVASSSPSAPVLRQLETKATMPPVALSPSQEMQDQAARAGPESVPVKKDPVPIEAAAER